MVTSFGEKIKHRLSIIKGYTADCLDYMRWEYNNSNNYTRNSFESKLSRQAHVLEKGMSLKNPKPQFGVKRAEELLEYVNEYIGAGYSVEESSAVINAIGVLRAYISFHQERGFEPASIIEGFKELEKYCEKVDFSEYGIKWTSRQNLLGGVLMLM